MKTLHYPAFPRHSFVSAILIGTALALTALSAPQAVSAEEESQEKTKRTVAMSQPVFKKLQKANEHVEAKEYAEALKLVKELQGRKKLSVYESAQVWNLNAYIHYLQENYTESIRSYEKILTQGEIPEALTQSTLKTLAQLYFTIDNYTKALEKVQSLISLVKKPSPDIYMLEGQAYYQLKKYKEAEKPIKTAIANNREQGIQPKENWLLLLRVIYYELKDYPNLLVTMKELIQRYPKNEYLLTIAGIYSEIGDTKKQLSLTEVLYEQGHLEQPFHAINLANLYLLHELPYKAAKLLQKEIDSKKVEATEQNLRLLSQAWYQARENEKSIPPLKRAAAISSDGSLYIRLAQSYINLDRWEEATEALQKGIQKGGLDRSDTANLMLGIALFNQKKLQLARSSFIKARKDKRSQKAAQQWIAYVDNELQREKVLNQKVPASTPLKDKLPTVPTMDLEG